MNAEKHKLQITVTSEAIDVRNHVNNLAYLEWCLQAAKSHWKLNASEDLQKDYVWYVLQHVIDYKASAFKGETLEVVTWVESSEGARSTRRFEIFRIKDQKLLVTAKTTWCLLNAKSLRPIKVPDEIRNLFTI